MIDPALFKAILKGDPQKIVEAAKIHFSIFDFELIESAVSINSQKPEPLGKITPEDFIEAIKEAFKILGLYEYSIRISDDNGFNFIPSVNKKEVVFSKNTDFQFFDVESEVRNELVHIIRYENGNFNNIKKR